VVLIIAGMQSSSSGWRKRLTAWRWLTAGGALQLVALAACTPLLDWREVRPVGSGLVLLFPCKPVSQARTLSLAGQSATMTLHGCQADGLTWALGQVNVGDPTRVAPAMAELRAATQAKMGEPTVPWAAIPSAVKATPHPQSGLARFMRPGPDGKPLQMQLAVFTRGTWVFQATVLGGVLPEEAVSNFISSPRWPS
jgi:hypothetical protein